MSAQESGQAPVLEDPASGLLAGAVRDRVLLEVDAAERLAAAGARLAEVAVDAVDVGVALPGEPELEAPRQVVVDGRREGVHLVVVELGGDAEGREPGLPEDLVRVGAPDPRERTLIAQEGVQ